MEKTLDQKLQECRMVYIQNIEKTMQTNMVYKYLKDQKIDQDVKKYTVNSKDGFITLEFNDHGKARNYYDKANFKHKILFRPFNIYFNLQLNQNEMKKYYFEGLTEENLRKMFQIARVVGVCKIYTSYTASTSKGKLKPTGVLSFIRKDQIQEGEFNKLQEQLLKIGVKISPYISDKGLKCTVYISNFYNAKPEEEETQIENSAKERAQKLIMPYINKDDLQSTTIIVKRKDVPDPENFDKQKIMTSVKALIEFRGFEAAISNFEKIRIGFLKQDQAKAVLNFHNAENNSYVSLFTSGLRKPEALSQKQFENKLVESFRKVTPEVLQVLIFPVEYNKTYVARVYLKSQQAGKGFIVDYTTKREYLWENYKDKQNIRFNINVDDKTMKKIKNMEKKATQIVKKIKNQEEAQKRAKKPINQYPINDMNMMRLPIQGNKMPINNPSMGGMMPMPNVPNMQNMQNMQNMPPNMPPIPNMPNMNMPNIPNMHMGGNMGSMGGNMGGNMGANMGGNMPMPMGGMKGQPQGNEHQSKIAKFVRDRDQLLQLAKKDINNEKTVKHSFVGPIKYLLQTRLRVPTNESGIQADYILMNNNVSSIIDFFENPEDKYREVYKN